MDFVWIIWLPNFDPQPQEASDHAADEWSYQGKSRSWAHLSCGTDQKTEDTEASGCPICAQKAVDSYVHLVLSPGAHVRDLNTEFGWCKCRIVATSYPGVIFFSWWDQALTVQSWFLVVISYLYQGCSHSRDVLSINAFEPPSCSQRKRTRPAWQAEGVQASEYRRKRGPVFSQRFERQNLHIQSVSRKLQGTFPSTWLCGIMPQT